MSIGLIGLLSNSLLFNLATQYLNAPYRYGANGPFEFDCSGLVITSINDYNRLNDLPAIKDKTAQGIYKKLIKEGYQCHPPTDGSILFYGSSDEKISHIAIHGARNLIIEAGGAGRRTKSMGPEELLKYCSEKDARVRFRNFGHRNDLVASIRFDI